MERTVHLLASMPVCYIYRQQEGRQAELPKGRRDFKMATLDVTEERRRAIDRVNRAYADEDYRFRVHYPEEWEFGLITGATFFGKRGLVLQHGEDDVSSFTLNPSWLSCEDETQRCIMVEIYLEP